jgi:subtilisin-like proprotein convertase family protein
MQSKFTQKNLGYLCTKIIALALIFSASTQLSFAQQNPVKANKLSPVEKSQQRIKTLSDLKANPKSDNDAGLPNRAVKQLADNPQAICTSWTVSITGADPTTGLRAFRDGIVKTCAAPGTCTAGLAGTFNYQIFQWTNPVAQCVTVTYTATNANFGFYTVHNAPPTLSNLCANWITDPGSSGTSGVPIVTSFNGTAGTTYYFLVTNVGAPPSNCTIQIDAPVCNATPCSGTPNPGATTGPNVVCPTVPFTVGITTPQNFAGITYQWQRSLTGIAGSFTDIGGATSSSYTTSITVPTWYQCNVRCTNSGITTTSSPAKAVAINPPSACYCAGGATDMVDEKISRVRYNTIDNSSTSQSGYEDFTAISTTVIQGSTQNITVNISNFFTGDLVKVWIDFNQNGSWTDPGEEVVSTTNTAANPAIGTITIPLTATLGPTRMRVRMYWQPADANPGPCGNTVYGQVEDYTVNVAPCIQGVFNTQPASTSVQCSANAVFTSNTTGSLLTYQWEYRTSPSGFWLNVTSPLNGAIVTGFNTNTLTINGVPASLNGYQFRLVIAGTCTAVDFSNVATLTVTPLIATLNVSSPVAICTGTVQQLTLTNASSPATTTFASGPISIQIPDLIGPPASAAAVCDAGINHTIPVVLPAGSQISRIDLKLNITHTYASDLKIVLKNTTTNQVMNLFYHKSGAQTAGANFTNTVISSVGTVRFSAVPPPFTGTFRADQEIGAGFYADASGSGPTGFPPTTTSWNTLWGGVNQGTGNWTIAICDAQEWAGDIGTLTDWMMDITYGAPAAGIWSQNTPAAPNSMFTDPAATIPYAGGLANTIYVKPLETAPFTGNSVTYCVVYNTASPTCASGPTCVTVNVTSPITGLLTPANKTACVGTNTSFNVAPGGGPLTYQWQVSVNNGLTWSNVGGATGSTLNLSAVTQLMNNNLYRVTVNASPCGSAITTAPGRLTVNQLPTVSISSTTLQLVPGRIATLTGTSLPAPFSTTSWSWTRNGTTIAGVTGNSTTANIDQQGEYQATVTDINGCTNTSNIVKIGSEASDKLWIYPNPNGGQFQVRLYYSGVQGERRIVRIYSAQGQLMAQKEFDLDSNTPQYLSMTFDLPLLSAGTYVVKVVDKNGGKITSGLMVIE